MTPPLDKSRPVAVSFDDVYVVFGDDGDGTALQMAQDGVGRDDVMDASSANVALSGVSFDVYEGEFFCVMGLSGCGKSTLVRCVNRLVNPSSGTVTVNGSDITGMSKGELKEARRTQFAMVFQGYGLMPHRTVLENVAWGLRLNQVPKEDRQDRAAEVLRNVGLAQWADSYPSGLSGGMKQRVGIARAMAMDTPILLMDEPFSEIDPILRRTLQKEIKDLHQTVNKTIIFITHKTNEALMLADRMAVMRDGKVVQVDEPHYLAMHPADDYVREFILEVREEDILTAELLMNRRIFSVQEDVMASAVRDLMEQRGVEHALVVNEVGVYAGTATVASVDAALATMDVPITDTALMLEPVVRPAMDMATLLRRAVMAHASLPVVGPTGVLAGEITLESLSEASRRSED